MIARGDSVSVKARADTPDELGSALREFRKRRGLSQRALAAEPGISQRYVFELEQGKPGVLMTRLFDVLHLLMIRMTLEQSDE
jgi:HTH-type transcriptional regulator/antitoxin HipB